MGCATVKEKLESKIMLLKLQKVDIILEREEKLKEYQKITGENLHRKAVPDYVIKEESEENNINIKKPKKKVKKIKKKGKEVIIILMKILMMMKMKVIQNKSIHLIFPIQMKIIMIQNQNQTIIKEKKKKT
jgi:hypothetical protein